MSKKKSGNYIGVTGVMSSADIYDGIQMIPRGAKHRFMAGVLADSKTLAGQINKLPGRYPKVEAIADIFVKDPRVLNLVHYSTDDPLKLCAEIRRIAELAGPHLDGFQLNAEWPSPSHVETIREMFPNLYLVLQIGRGVMEEPASMRIFEAALSWYVHFIDGILIDGSGGNNVPLNAVKVAEYLRVAEQYPFDLGFAGGLSSRTLIPVIQLAVEFGTKLSTAAEGGIRTPPPEDALDRQGMRNYLRHMYAIFG